MEPSINISAENRKKSAELLNSLLADEFVLYIKTLNFHWNVESMHFSQLHTFFENQYEELLEVADSVAERCRAVGHVALGSMSDFMKRTRLKEAHPQPTTDKDMIKHLLIDHEAIICTLRVDVETTNTLFKDSGTSNFLLNLLEKHEKMAWMLRAHI